jgi:hypothetical protein
MRLENYQNWFCLIRFISTNKTDLYVHKTFNISSENY